MTYEMNQDGSYKDLEFTNFPAKIDSWEDSEDVSSDYLDAANNYKAALAKGNYATAQNILLSNPKLKNMLIGAKDINELKHAVMAIERLYTEDVKSLITDYSNEVKENSQKATTAASSAMSSKTVAEEKAQETAESLENLKTLKGTLPTDFTEYVAQVNQTADNAVNKTSHDYVKSVEQTENNVTVNFGDDANPVVIDKYSLPAATVDALGGVKAGDNVTVTEDGKLSITANNVAGALGFTPLAPQLPYTMTFETCYVGNGVVGPVSSSDSNKTLIPISKQYDAIYIVPIPKQNVTSTDAYYTKNLVLPFLFGGSVSKCSIIPLKNDSFTLGHLPGGIINGSCYQLKSSTFSRYYFGYDNVSHIYEIYSDLSSPNAEFLMNVKDTTYYVFGIDWNIKIPKSPLDTVTNEASE